MIESIWIHIQEAAVAYGPSLIAALLVLIIGWWVAKIVKGAATGAMRRGKVDETLVKFAGNILYFLAMAFVVIAALGKLGVNTASFAAILAAAGLAIGFALQGSLANFAAGVMMIAFRPIKVGDYVEAGGVSGTVEEISIFATTFNTPDNKQVIVGNADITGGPITNYSTKPTRRVDMVFGIGYSDDIDRAKGILEGILAQDSRVLAEPAPQVVVSELADSSVNFHVRPWVNTADYWSVFFETTEKVKKAFDAAGVSIPFPQRDVHIFQETA
jgi:small conductance mechanosensitive channel